MWLLRTVSILALSLHVTTAVHAGINNHHASIAPDAGVLDAARKNKNDDKSTTSSTVDLRPTHDGGGKQDGVKTLVDPLLQMVEQSEKKEEASLQEVNTNVEHGILYQQDQERRKLEIAKKQSTLAQVKACLIKVHDSDKPSSFQFRQQRSTPDFKKKENELSSQAAEQFARLKVAEANALASGSTQLPANFENDQQSASSNISPVLVDTIMTIVKNEMKKSESKRPSVEPLAPRLRQTRHNERNRAAERDDVQYRVVYDQPPAGYEPDENRYSQETSYDRNEIDEPRSGNEDNLNGEEQTPYFPRFQQRRFDIEDGPTRLGSASSARRLQYEDTKARESATKPVLLEISQVTTSNICNHDLKANKTCQICVSNPLCGWCSNALGEHRCLPHNVNAPPTGGSFIEDGLVSGACKVEDWHTRVQGGLTLLNLNMFAGDEKFLRKRLEILQKLVERTRPDVLTFQELTPSSLLFLKASEVFKPYFHSDMDSDTLRGQLHILSRFPILKVNYFEEAMPDHKSIDSRPRVLIATIRVHEEEIVLATTALDWRSSKSRLYGIRFVMKMLAIQSARTLMLTGDFKAREKEMQQLATSTSSRVPWRNDDDGYLDVWKTIHGKLSTGNTWDPEHNLYAKFVDPESRPNRLDRVLLRSTTVKPLSIDLVGCSESDLACKKIGAHDQTDKMADAGDAQRFPSTHYGLLANFTFFKTSCE